MTRWLVRLAVTLAAGVGLWLGALLGLKALDTYFYGVLLPRVVAEIRVAAAGAIREGAGGALSDVTGGFLGRGSPGGALPQHDPCRVVPRPLQLPFGIPGLRGGNP